MVAERLQKILSRAGISSRRQAENLIEAGKVSVNGAVVLKLGSKADPEVDKIIISGKPIQLSSQFHYYVYYKPRGLLVSKRDDWGGKTVFDALKLPPEVNAVGRLDKDSEGLLLLTDDGDFLQSYTHPSFQIPKIYHVQITRPLTEQEVGKMLKGIELEEKVVKAFRVVPVKKKAGIWVEMELREGVKREIRRMLSSLRVGVLRLIRVQHGTLRLGSLRPGEIRELPKKP